MNNKDYLDRLKKLLSPMQKQARDDILKEISSHIEQANENEHSLIERFGTPESLAEQYLEGEIVKPTLSQNIGSITKKLLLGVGIFTVIVIGAIAGLKNYFSTDEFDYANENAPELVNDRDQWSSIQWLTPITVHIDQSQVVFYWHAQSELSWKCKNKDGIDQGPSSAMIIRHNSCLVYLPLQESTIRINQSSAILVRPQASTLVDVTQSELRIAENGQPYQFELDGKRSDIHAFESQPNAEVVISIAATESKVSAY